MALWGSGWVNNGCPRQYGVLTAARTSTEPGWPLGNDRTASTHPEHTVSSSGHHFILSQTLRDVSIHRPGEVPSCTAVVVSSFCLTPLPGGTEKRSSAHPVAAPRLSAASTPSNVQPPRRQRHQRSDGETSPLASHQTVERGVVARSSTEHEAGHTNTHENKFYSACMSSMRVYMILCSVHM